MRHIQGIFIFLFLMLGLVLSGCGKDDMGFNAHEDEEGMVNLDLQIDASLLGGMDTKASEEEVPTAEKVHAIRVIIVRQSGLVEHNILTKVNPGQAYLLDLSFKVKGSEKKTIYLLANENATRVLDSGETWSFVKFDYSSLQPGEVVPQEALDALLELPSSGEAILDEVPMTNVETFDMPDTDASKSMLLERAVAKFTLVIKNSCTTSRRVDSIMVHKVSRKSYMMPHKTESGFLMPESLVPEDYITYVHPVGKTMDGGTKKTLQSFYLLESQYEDPEDARNYRMEISVDGNLFEKYFPDMSVLNRGDHIMVNITINESSLEADVFPWGTYVLNPVFGQ